VLVSAGTILGWMGSTSWHDSIAATSSQAPKPRKFYPTQLEEIAGGLIIGMWN
jgi:hypothetical protein